MEPLLLPWILKRKHQASLELVPVIKRPKLNPKPIYRLIAFCTRDVAETSRLILAYANVEYENITISNRTELLTIDAAIGPFDYPICVLDWNGKIIPGNDAVARLLAKMYNLAGDGFFEQAQADTIVGIVNDLARNIIRYIKGFYGYKVIDLAQTYYDVFVPSVKRFFSMLEHYASEASPNGFLFSSGVTYADLALANMVDLLSNMHPELMSAYSNCHLIARKVFALPQLQKYLATRPTMHEIVRNTCTFSHNLEVEYAWCPKKQKDVTVFKHKALKNWYP